MLYVVAWAKFVEIVEIKDDNPPTKADIANDVKNDDNSLMQDLKPSEISEIEQNSAKNDGDDTLVGTIVVVLMILLFAFLFLYR